MTSHWRGGEGQVAGVGGGVVRPSPTCRGLVSWSRPKHGASLLYLLMTVHTTAILLSGPTTTVRGRGRQWRMTGGERAEVGTRHSLNCSCTSVKGCNIPQTATFESACATRYPKSASEATKHESDCAFKSPTFLINMNRILRLSSPKLQSAPRAIVEKFASHLRYPNISANFKKLFIISGSAFKQ